MSTAANRRLLVLLLAGVTLAGCSAAAQEVREHTYPPDLRYLSRGEVESAMWKLSGEVYALDQALRAPGPIDPAARAEILGHLRALDEAAASLDGGIHKSNRPEIDAHLEDFRKNVALARAAAEADPPNYFLAGSVVGGCMYCHGGSRP